MGCRFRPKDIKSICGLGDSQKVGGSFIGQKGLGFKSVFAASATPYVVSGPFQFRFGAPPGAGEASDAMQQYITPTNVDVASDLLCAPLWDTTLLRTTFLLPLRPELTLESLKTVGAMLNPEILLTSRKLQRLTFRDLGSGVATCTESEVSPLEGDCAFLNSEALSYTDTETTFSVHFKTTQCCNRKITVATTPCATGQSTGTDVPTTAVASPAIQTTARSFRIYEFSFDVNSRTYIEPQRKNVRSTTVRIAIPLSQLVDADDEPTTYPVCAGLPVLDVGLPFVLDADWILVTSRESVHENHWNSWIRTHSAEAYVHLFLHDAFMQANMKYFLPSVNPTMPLWWRMFVLDVTAGVKNHFLQENGGRVQKLASPLMVQLRVSDAQMEQFAGIKVKHGSAELLKVAADVGIQEVSICDVVACFGANARNNFDCWAQEQSNSWWELFFQLCLKCPSDQAENLRQLAQARALFIVRQPLCGGTAAPKQPQETTPRGFLPRDKDTGRCVDVYCSETPSFLSWRPDVWAVLDANYEWEAEFLKKYIKPQRLTSKRLCYSILALHETLSTTVPKAAAAQVWLDLLYIRDHKSVFDEALVANYPGLVAAKHSVLKIPCRTTPTGFVKVNSIKDAQLSTLIGSPVPHGHCDMYADTVVEGYRARGDYAESPMDTVCEFVDALQWERFLTQMGAAPALNLLSEPIGVSAQLVLPTFEVWPTEAFEAATDLCKHYLEHSVQSYAAVESVLCQHLYMPTFDGTTLCAVSQLHAFDLFDSMQMVLPCVKLPMSPLARELASMLGVSIERTTAECLKVFDQLACEQNTSLDLWHQWLWHCAQSLNRMAPGDALPPNCLTTKIYLPGDGKSEWPAQFVRALIPSHFDHFDLFLYHARAILCLNETECVPDPILLLTSACSYT